MNYLNPQDFALPALGTFGNLGKGFLVGPGLVNWDMAGAKSFTVTERLHVQLRGEFFNILNHANFFNPGSTALSNSATSSVSGSGFGQITAAASPRIGQLALKVTF